MRLRVLVADDDDRVLTALEALLQSAGYCVVAKASGGEEACRLNATLEPDVVLLDLRMPDMDGVEAANRIMQTRPTPVILCTACYDEDLVLRAAKAGVYAYLLKPCRITDLVTAITIARHRYEETSILRREIKNLADALEARKWIEKAKGIVMRTQSLDEEQAHRFLQMESQRRSQPLVDLARALVTAEDMFKVKIAGMANAE